MFDGLNITQYFLLETFMIRLTYVLFETTGFKKLNLSQYRQFVTIRYNLLQISHVLRLSSRGIFEWSNDRILFAKDLLPSNNDRILSVMIVDFQQGILNQDIIFEHAFMFYQKIHVKLSLDDQIKICLSR